MFCGAAFFPFLLYLSLALTAPSMKPSTGTEKKKRNETAQMPVPDPKTWMQLFIDSFDDTTLIILIVSAVVSLAVSLLPFLFVPSLFLLVLLFPPPPLAVLLKRPQPQAISFWPMICSRWLPRGGAWWPPVRFLQCPVLSCPVVVFLDRWGKS